MKKKLFIISLLVVLLSVISSNVLYAIDTNRTYNDRSIGAGMEKWAGDMLDKNKNKETTTNQKKYSKRENSTNATNKNQRSYKWF